VDLRVYFSEEITIKDIKTGWSKENTIKNIIKKIIESIINLIIIGIKGEIETEIVIDRFNIPVTINSYIPFIHPSEQSKGSFDVLKESWE
jgi:hypothetical protein